MANTKSALKNIRKSTTRTLHNRTIKNRLRTLNRRLRESLDGDDQEARVAAAKLYLSALDKAAKTEVIHRNVANRQKAKFAPVLFGTK